VNTPPRKRAEVGIFKEVWKETNRILDYAREISATGGRGVRVNRNVNGTFLTADIPIAKPSQPGTVRAYSLVSVGNDTCTCTDTETGESVQIAKPIRLRRTGWHGQTVTLNDGNGASYQASFNYLSAVKRTVQIGSYIEYQVIVPGYQPGVDIIFASISENGTGLDGVDLIDLNTEGRAWARSRLQTA